MEPVDITHAIELRAGEQKPRKRRIPAYSSQHHSSIFSMPSATSVISRSVQQLIIDFTIACLGPLRWISLTISVDFEFIRLEPREQRKTSIAGTKIIYRQPNPFRPQLFNRAVKLVEA